MNSVLFARVGARADRSSNVGSARVRGTPAALLGVVISLSSAGLGLTGCSFHAHSEWHSGKGGTSSAGAENQAQPEPSEPAHRSSHRQSPGGRDNVVRVTGSHKSAGEGGGGNGEEPARTAVHPTGDVPASSGGSSASSGGGSGSGGSVGTGDGSGASGGGNAASAPAADAPAQTAEPAPAADASRDESSSTGKGTNKSPSEPHITTPSQRKPRKVHRNGDGETNKEGRRE